MEMLTFTFKGTCPLLVNNPQTANPLHPYTQLLKELTSKRVKTDDDHRQIQRLKWEASLYLDDEIGPYLPGTMAWKSIYEAAKLSRQGKAVERGLEIISHTMPIEYDGPRDVEGMWDAKVFLDVRDGMLNGSRVMAARAIFREWMIRFQGAFSPEILNMRDLKTFADIAGKMVGIGTYRRRYGRFTVSA